MEGETKSKRFYYAAAENGSPLDYSFLEITDKWKADIPRGKGELKFRWDSIVDYTRNSDFFSNVFPQKIPEDNSDEKKQPPLFVEAEAFFRDYTLTILNTKYSERKGMRNPENKKLPKHFGVDFFKNVHASIRRSHDTLAYYEKILYNDPKFQSFATEYYWEAEFDKRCRLLKDAILKCPPSKRLSEMPSILSFLDANIGAYAALATRFQNKSETFSESVVSEGSAQEFLERLSLKLYKLRKKKRVVIGGQKLQAYIFDDLPVIAGGEKTQSLDIIFSRFRQKTSTSENDKASEEKQALLKTYREAYLSSLSKNFKECDFLIQARELDNYLQA